MLLGFGIPNIFGSTPTVLPTPGQLLEVKSAAAKEKDSFPYLRPAKSCHLTNSGLTQTLDNFSRRNLNVIKCRPQNLRPKKMLFLIQPLNISFDANGVFSHQRRPKHLCPVVLDPVYTFRASPPQQSMVNKQTCGEYPEHPE